MSGEDRQVLLSDRSRSVAGRAFSRAKRVWVRLCLCVAVSLVGAATVPIAYAGSGTAADPWTSPHVNWYRPSTSGWVSQIYSDMTPLTTASYSFYSANTPLAANGGYYIGVQRVTSSSDSRAIFSVFAQSSDTGWSPTTYRLLDSTHCNLGADGNPTTSPGVSCAMVYSITITSYRVSTDVVLSSNPALCPSSSPTACLVYTGYVGLTSQPYTRYQIGKWSLNLSVYGDLQYTDYFVETFAGPCVTKPHGQFVYPHYAINGNGYYSPGAFSGDAPPPNNCGRSYLDSWISADQRII